MPSRDEIRLKIFSAYSSNIMNICGKKNGQVGYHDSNGEFKEVKKPYICPICGLLFQEESLDQKSPNPLTLEDVPPKKLGGKPIILTCKNCNNKLGGTKLDAKLIWDLEIDPFLKRKPESKIKAYYEINKRTKVKGELEFVKEKKYGLHFNPKSNPNLKQELDFLVQNWNNSTIRFTIQAPNKRIVHLALLRLAYLQMVAKFGYGYYLNDSARKIREQLVNTELDIIPNFGIPNFDSVPADKEGIHFIKAPKKFQSFLVVFNVKLKGIIKTLSVLIPGPSEECLKLYTVLKESKKSQFDIVSFQNLDILKEANYPFAYNEIWNYYQNNYEC